jgi:hypothetical protein
MALKRLSTCRLKEKVLEGLQNLAHPYHAPTAEQCKAAADCDTCHGANGVPGVVCDYCRLHAIMLKWETKLFTLEARAKKFGVLVSEEEAFEEYVRSVSGTVQSEEPDGPLGGSTRTTGSSTSFVRMTHRDNEHQVMLTALRDKLRGRNAGTGRFVTRVCSPPNWGELCSTTVLHIHMTSATVASDLQPEKGCRRWIRHWQKRMELAPRPILVSVTQNKQLGNFMIIAVPLLVSCSLHTNDMPHSIAAGCYEQA